MILLDTNVVSETMRPHPEPSVIAWLDAQAAETLYMSSITAAELMFGVRALPDGRRKDALADAVEQIIALFAERLLDFDMRAARQYADLASKARSAGLALSTPDGFIAAIASANGFSVASRDIGPFRAAGVSVIDPWITT